MISVQLTHTFAIRDHNMMIVSKILMFQGDSDSTSHVSLVAY